MTLADFRFARLESALAASDHNTHLAKCGDCGIIEATKTKPVVFVYCHVGLNLFDIAHQKRGRFVAMAKKAGEAPIPVEILTPSKPRGRS